MRKIKHESVRFARKIKPCSCCWIWSGAKDGCGYGKLICGSRETGWREFKSAHRLAYELFIGPIPFGLSVLHKCDVRACCNPAHLYAGTQKENVRDAVARGRWKPQSDSPEKRSALTRQDVVKLRAEYASGVKRKELSKRYGIGLSGISHICKRRSWSNVQ
jgi:hypothetical protein